MVSYIAQTPCWVITLNPEGEAIRKLLSSLKAQQLDAQPLLGVDGRSKMPELTSGECLSNTATHWRYLRELNNSEVGCYLSHFRAIRSAYEAGLDRICILEDDVQLEAGFGSVLAELEQLPAEVEMIRLMGLKIRKRKVVQALSDDIHKLVRPERGWSGAQGYLVNRRGMKKILANANRIYEPIDEVFDHFWMLDLQLYGVEPHILWETEHPSSIVKSKPSNLRIAPWCYWLFSFGRLWRSIERHTYMRRHAKDFYPAQKPEVCPGRTVTMK